MNIGIHLFDPLLHLFGSCREATLRHRDETTLKGELSLDRADVDFLLSIDRRELPAGQARKENRAYRSLAIDGEEHDLSGSFEHLHSAVYREVLAGRGAGVETVRSSLELVHLLSGARPVADVGTQP